MGVERLRTVLIKVILLDLVVISQGLELSLTLGVYIFVLDLLALLESDAVGLVTLHNDF